MFFHSCPPSTITKHLDHMMVIETMAIAINHPWSTPSCTSSPGGPQDQSLRAWLCGGDIVRAKSSRVAHMWRTGDRRTATWRWMVGTLGIAWEVGSLGVPKQ